VAHKKGGGSTRLGRDSQSKRLGVKRYAGQSVNAGTIDGVVKFEPTSNNRRKVSVYAS